MRLPWSARKVLALAGCVLVTGSRAVMAQAPAKEDPWRSLRFMLGEWTGESDGEPGKGTLKRGYRFVLGNKFLHEHNVSTYPPQPKNQKGEVHEHWSFFSHDRARKTIVFRQFHQEGFVNQYVMLPEAKPNTVVFETEALENLPSGWKARETYEVLSQDEFVETFELAEPGGAYRVYSQNRFKRARQTSAPPGGSEELLRLEEAWNAAHLKGDADALDALWDADLVVTVPRMSHISRAAALALTRSGRIKFDKYETTDVKARVYEDAAIVEGRLYRSRRMNDDQIDDNWLFTKVYVRRGTQWKVVVFHASDAPK